MPDFILQIQFQFGEFANQGAGSTFFYDLWISILGAFFGILGALFLYWWQVSKHENAVLTNATWLLKNILSYFESLESNLFKYSSNLKELPHLYHHLTSPVDYDIKRFVDKIDQSTFHQAYLSRFRNTRNTNELFFRIYELVDFLSEHSIQIKLMAEKQQNSINRRQHEFKDIFNTLYKDISKLSISFYFRDQHPNWANALDTIVRKYQLSISEESSDLLMQKNKLIDPLQQFFINSKPNHESLNEILLHSRDCNSIFEGIKRQNISHSKEINKSANSIQNAVLELRNKTSEFISQQENMSNWSNFRIWVRNMI